MPLLLLLLGAVAVAAIAAGGTTGAPSNAGAAGRARPPVPNPEDRRASGYCGTPTTDDPRLKMSGNDEVKTFSPNGLRWLVIPNLRLADNGSIIEFSGLDAEGQWWYTGIAYCGLRAKGVSGPCPMDMGDAPGSDTGSWFDHALGAFANAVVTVGIPVIAAGLTAFGGVPGAITGTAILAWRNLANGQSLKDSIINGNAERLASTPSQLDAFNQGLNAIRHGFTQSQIVHAITTLIPTKEAQQAYQEAVQIGRAKQVQELTASALKMWMQNTPQWSVGQARWGNNNDASALDTALHFGGNLTDAMFGIRGLPGLAVLDQVSKTAVGLVQANVNHPDVIQSYIDFPQILTVWNFSAGTPPKC